MLVLVRDFLGGASGGGVARGGGALRGWRCNGFLVDRDGGVSEFVGGGRVLVGDRLRGVLLDAYGGVRGG